MFKNIPVIDSLRKKYRPDLINWMLYYNKYYHQHYSKIKKLLSGSDEKALLQIIQQHFDSGIVKKENYEKPVNYGEYLKNKIEKAEKGHPDFELTQRNLYVIEDIADQNVEDLFLDDMIKLWKSLAKDKSVKKASKKSVKKAPVQGSLFTMQKKKTTPSKKKTLKSTKKTALLSLIPRKKK